MFLLKRKREKTKMLKLVIINTLQVLEDALALIAIGAVATFAALIAIDPESVYRAVYLLN